MLYAVSTPKPFISCPRSSLFQQRHLVSTRLSVRASLPDNSNGVKVGFETVDQIAQAEGVVMNKIQSKALIGIGCIKEVPILIAKPQAYMNFSGESSESVIDHLHGCQEFPQLC